MRYFFLPLLLCLLAPSLAAQNGPIRKFIREHNNGPENVSVMVPGFLIGLSTDIALSVMGGGDDEDAIAALHLAQRFGTARVLVVENQQKDFASDLAGLVRELEASSGYERWTTVRAAGGEQVEVLVRMRGKRIRNVFVAVAGEPDSEALLVTARTDISGEELGQIINDFQKRERARKR